MKQLITTKFLITLGFVFFSNQLLASSPADTLEDRIKLDSVELYYQSKGKGQPIILIPGWGYTADVFEKNISAFSEKYQVYAYDPRSHGRSQVTTTGNNYQQHGQDLHQFITSLGLKEVVLVGWSFGATTALSYFEQYGTNNIKAFINVDETPVIIKKTENDWGEDTAAGISGFVEAVKQDYLAIFKDYMTHCFVNKAPEELVTRFTQYASSLTPDMAAGLLEDASKRDYSETAIAVAQKIPVMQILRKDWSEQGLTWIEENQPSAQTFVLGNHLMLYEYPDLFNSAVLEFIERNTIKQ